jgi:hypothetical protein
MTRSGPQAVVGGGSSCMMIEFSRFDQAQGKACHLGSFIPKTNSRGIYKHREA